MKKLQIEIPVLLPEVPDEKDQCVTRLTERLSGRQGIERVHVADGKDHGVPQLCFHYDPEEISIDRIQSLARQTGASLTEKFGHQLMEVEGIRHTRHARLVERNFLQQKGILEASVSGSGMVRVEYDTAKINKAEILDTLRKEGLTILNDNPTTDQYPGRIKETAPSKRPNQRKRARSSGRGQPRSQ